MSFNPLAGIMVAKLRGLLAEAPAVIEFGNQTLACRKRYAEIVEILAGAIRAEAFQGITTTEEFYHAVGFGSYAAIDVNAQFGSLVMDLNQDLATAYQFTTQYDLVTNNGTGEHIFDQKTVLQNAHNLCKPGGLMLHIMPFQNWINHGFYNFQPKLYLDVALANHYQVEAMYLAERNGQHHALDLADAGRTRNPGKGESSVTRALAKLLKRGPVNVQVVAVLRRVTPDAFRVPCDSRYLDAIDDDAIKECYDV